MVDNKDTLGVRRDLRRKERTGLVTSDGLRNCEQPGSYAQVRIQDLHIWHEAQRVE